MRLIQLRAFAADCRAVVTVQVVVFSIMLFAALGLMLDFGRAYSAHSNLQTYVDRVALRAAAELDGTAGAIARAQAAAAAEQRYNPFLDDVSGTTYDPGKSAVFDTLIFLSGPPTDANGNFDQSQLAALATTDDALAAYAVVGSAPEVVVTRLLQFTGADPSQGGLGLPLSANAVATHRTATCQGLSTLVMCNPFEGDTTTDFRTEMSAATGYRMRLTADGSGLTTAANQINLATLKTPHETMDVNDQSICSGVDLSRVDPITGTTITTNLLPGVGGSMDMEKLRDICLLAHAEPGLGCVNDQALIRAADPETVTTGLGVIWDYYDPPMDEILTNDLNVSDFMGNILGGSAYTTRSEAFYPDPVVNQPNVSRDGVEFYLTDPASPESFFFTITGLAPLWMLKFGPNAPDTAQFTENSRRWDIYDLNKLDQRGYPPIESCFQGSTCSTAPHPAMSSNAPNIEEHLAVYYRPWSLRQAAEAAGIWPWTGDWQDMTDAQLNTVSLAAPFATFLEFYRGMEWTDNDDILTEFLSQGLMHDDDLTTNAATGYRYTQSGAEHFEDELGYFPANPTERRLQRITVVNCDAAQPYSTVTGQTNPDYNDAYFADVVDTIEVFMLAPPFVRTCSNVSDPGLFPPFYDNVCAGEFITEVELDVEVVGLASQDPANYGRREFSVLVH